MLWKLIKKITFIRYWQCADSKASIEICVMKCLTSLDRLRAISQVTPLHKRNQYSIDFSISLFRLCTYGIRKLWHPQSRALLTKNTSGWNFVHILNWTKLCRYSVFGCHQSLHNQFDVRQCWNHDFMNSNEMGFCEISSNFFRKIYNTSDVSFSKN